MANMATITSVTLPGHLYPHIETRINDNSVRRYTVDTSGNYKMLAVSLTPKGEDGKIITVEHGIDEYDTLFGHGPCSKYGQAHLNARAAASTGLVTLQVLRLTATNATYANAHVFMCYRIFNGNLEVVFEVMNTDDLNDLNKLADNAPSVEQIQERLALIEQPAPIADGETGTTGGDEIDPGMNVNAWNITRFMSFAYKGKGTCGNDISIRISNHGRADKTSRFKNYYLDIFEGTRQIESHRVTLHPDCLVGSNSVYIENVVNSYGGSEGSNVLVVDVNDEVLNTVFTDYQLHIDPNTALTTATFDPILGINKELASPFTVTNSDGDTAIEHYNILSYGLVRFDAMYGIKLLGGSDGNFAMSDPNRQANIDARFIEAFEGKIDRNIMSKYRCPLDYACDANFSTAVKTALANMVTGDPGIGRSQDFRIYFDLGTDLAAGDDVYESSKTYNDIIDTWTMSIDGYYGKIKDPYNKKVIPVTSTYHLAQALPKHWNGYGGYHIPYANSKFGVIDTFLPNTVFPVFDDSIDQKILDKLVEAHVNYAAIDPKGNVMRATQTTRYSGLVEGDQFATSDDYVVSNLSEENNALIALAIKKDVEKLICTYLYNFNETSDINTFNRDTANLTSKYAAAQVRSITARFERTEAEAELGVLHLYIAIQNKPLIKYLQVDIDVNRLETN